jgi:UDP-N-acetylmuramoyl-tripeptide--D-alanyl-D-alanine ligase
MQLSGSAIEQATNGFWHGPAPEMITGLMTDTRKFESGQAFLALRGPHFDGHRFAASVADRAQALIGDAAGVGLWRDLETCQLEVPDTLRALGDIARAWRLQLEQTLVIAISGSHGKTSVRSLLQHGFSALGLHVAASRANLNNLVGVPETLLSIDRDADLALIECGISEVGEMRRLAAMVRPDIAVMTAIGAAHGEGLGGEAGIVREKAALLERLDAPAWAALGAGVAGRLKRLGIALPEQTLSMDQPDAVQWRLEGTRLQLHQGGEQAGIRLSLPARHWAANLALAANVMLRVMHQRGEDVSLAQAAALLADWQPPNRRLQPLSGRGGCVILDDCYNAAPASMQAALDTLTAMDGRHVAVLGDMAELGAQSRQAHEGLNLAGVDEIYLIGLQMKALAARYPAARWFETTAEAIDGLQGREFAAQDIILVKASRYMALEAVTDFLLGAQVRQEGEHVL